MMLWLKGCFHCGGDLFEGYDIFGKYISCIQCGTILNEVQEQQLRGTYLKTKKYEYATVVKGPWAMPRKDAA